MQATVRMAYGNRTRELSLMLRAWVKVGTPLKLDKAGAVVTLAQYLSHCVRVAGMSFQVSILKILAGQPDGRASMDVVKQYLAVLYTSGPEWVARTKCLAERAPDLDIFSQKLVAREPGEWRITDEGKAFLAALERPTAGEAEPTLDELIEHPPTSDLPPLPTPQHRRGDDRRRRRKRRAGGVPPRMSA